MQEQCYAFVLRRIFNLVFFLFDPGFHKRLKNTRALIRGTRGREREVRVSVRVREPEKEREIEAAPNSQALSFSSSLSSPQNHLRYLSFNSFITILPKQKRLGTIFL